MARYYGIEVVDHDSTTDVHAGQQAWPRVGIRRRFGAAPVQTEVQVGVDLAFLHAAGQLSIEVRPVVGQPGSFACDVVAPRPVDWDELIHPLLSFPAAVVAHWTDRWAFHAAAVTVDDAAWLLLAPPGGGKSTMAAILSRRGYPVLSDDLSIAERDRVHAGPRSCDLRPESAQALGVGSRLAFDGTRSERFRHILPACDDSLPIRGFIELRWGEERCGAVGATERLASLASQRALDLPLPPQGLLPFVGLPFFEVVRPQRIDQCDRAADLVEACWSR